MPLLEIRNVAKSFGAIRAVNDMNFVVEPSEVVGLMGDNGAGKSTMVKMIAGNFPPTEGDVLVEGEVCQFNKPIEARAKGIEVVYQDLALADNLTAAENVFLGREMKKGVWPFRVLDKQAMIDKSSCAAVGKLRTNAPKKHHQKKSPASSQERSVQQANAVGRVWNDD